MKTIATLTLGLILSVSLFGMNFNTVEKPVIFKKQISLEDIADALNEVIYTKTLQIIIWENLILTYLDLNEFNGNEDGYKKEIKDLNYKIKVAEKQVLVLSVYIEELKALLENSTEVSDTQYDFYYTVYVIFYNTKA